MLTFSHFDGVAARFSAYSGSWRRSRGKCLLLALILAMAPSVIAAKDPGKTPKTTITQGISPDTGTFTKALTTGTLKVTGAGAIDPKIAISDKIPLLEIAPNATITGTLKVTGAGFKKSSKPPISKVTGGVPNAEALRKTIKRLKKAKVGRATKGVVVPSGGAAPLKLPKAPKAPYAPKVVAPSNQPTPSVTAPQRPSVPAPSRPPPK